ncbi:MAG TPA: alpha/beta hydrolase [Polyangiaceae bacterium]|nr:alpha/beta hydrolase [Polyangiaceae bacterium]
MFKWAALALAVFLPAGGLRAGAKALSRAYLFPVSEIAKVAPPADFVQHRLVASDGVAVHAIELPAPAGGRTLVHFHNNRQTVEAVADFARAMRSRGLGVLLVEYRGYGESGGEEPSEEGLYRDAEAALDMLAARGEGPDRVVLSGTSLGTGIAAEMARRGRGSRLVLVTPYTSIPDLVTDRVPGVPARLLLADRFETLAKAPDIHVPTLVIHGDADEIVPFAMGHRVADAIAGSRFLRVPGGHHGDLFARDGRRLLDAIAALGT